MREKHGRVTVSRKNSYLDRSVILTSNQRGSLLLVTDSRESGDSIEPKVKVKRRHCESPHKISCLLFRLKIKAACLSRRTSEIADETFVRRRRQI